ncbi:amidase domain-containing protein [Streptomyces massasporeus]|uniref:amidase domain-containing protein n=1 Tax=Streptomyces massasporeus TaxID=67324 RepID=UPI0037112E91
MPLTGAFRHGRRRGVWRWTHTWTVAKKQVLFFLEHSNGKWLGENQSAAKRGDIVFFGWNGKGIYDHAGVITKVKNGKAYVTAHNKNRLDKPLNECLAAPTREPTTRSSASSHTDTEGKMRMKKRVILLCGGLLIVTGIAAAVWWNWLRAPYALADSPKVDVTVAYEETGQRQNLLLVKDDGHWWIGLGDGDPAAGK